MFETQVSRGDFKQFLGPTFLLPRRLVQAETKRTLNNVLTAALFCFSADCLCARNFLQLGTTHIRPAWETLEHSF
jgi:hypothetical protein